METRLRRMVARPGMFEIFGEFFDRRMRGASAALGNDEPGGGADENGAQDRRNTFEVIHIVALPIISSRTTVIPRGERAWDLSVRLGERAHSLPTK